LMVVVVMMMMMMMTTTTMISNNLQERRVQNSVCNYIQLTYKKFTYLKVQNTGTEVTRYGPVGGSSVLLHVTLLSPRIFRWLLHFLKLCVPLLIIQVLCVLLCLHKRHITADIYHTN
jgi:hypothetical protein